MKAFLLFPIVLSLLFCACSTERQAQKKVAWLVSRDKLDDACARYFPPRDSVGKSDTLYVQADNEDYTATIDRLLQKIDSLYGTSTADSLQASIGHKECLEVVDAQDREIRKVASEFLKLKSSYKPCKPDVVTIEKTVWRENTAEVDRLKGVVNEKDKVVAQRDKTVGEKDDKIRKMEKWKWLFFGLLGLNVLGIVFRLFILKRPI